MKSDAKKTQRFDEQEPKATVTAAPVFIFIVLALLAYWAALYVEEHGGGFRKEVYAPFQSLGQVKANQPVTAGGEAFARGLKLYSSAGCVACHQANGLGSVGVAPPLAGSEWVLSKGSGRALRVAYNGLQGQITVKGVEWNLAMPAMGQQMGLKDQDLADLMTYIRGNADWGNQAAAVTVEQVKAHRAALDGRTQPWTAEELLKVPDAE